MSSKKAYDIAIIGAGMSGICAGIQLKKQLGITSFTIFEKCNEVGGTWLNNVYPGCASDIPSHLYSFSFALNPNWSTKHPPQAEILEYLKDLTNKYKVYECIKFQHEVTVTTWNEKLMKWVVNFVNLSIPNGEEETKMFDILIIAPGALRVPLVPREFKDFTGPAMHTAEWNNEIDLKNKKVAIIGSGASAVQVIPSIVDTVGSLHCYQRKPPYVMKKHGYEYSNFIKKVFFYFPFIMWLYRCFIYITNELTHSAFNPKSFLHKYADADAKKFREKELKGHKQLLDDLTPKYSLGCKRILISDDYYAAMARPNVRVHTSHTEKIVGQTIYSKDGTKEEFDVLILATGFQVHGYFSPMRIYGKNGEDIFKLWTEKVPRSYYGIVASCIPNSFALVGPNTALGHNSLLFMVECQMNYIISAIKEMANRNAKVINLKTSAEDAFMVKLEKDLKNTVWGTEDCGSLYANSRGEITTLWGQNCTNYWRQVRNPDWSKIDFI